MIKSMTGYGSAKGTVEGLGITVELKSVNNRYLDASVRMPRSFLFAEDAVKSVVQKHISRGKVDVFVSVDSSAAGDMSVKVNEPLLRGYVEAIRHIAEEYSLPDDVTALSVSRFPDVLTVEKNDIDAEAISQGIIEIAELALQDFDAMRLREGEKLRDDVTEKLASIDALVTKIEKESPKTVAEYRARLEARMAEVLGTAGIEESRILAEAAVFADHVAVDEETVRLRSHMSQLKTMINGSSPTGRKIDFLIQEFNREANTIGSKCQSSDIAQSQDGRAVRNDCYQIAFVRVTVNLFGVSFDFAARSCDAGRIGQRQVVLRVIGLRRYDRDFPWAAFAVIAQSLLIHFTFSHYPNCFACVCETQREKTCNYCALPSRNGHRTGRS